MVFVSDLHYLSPSGCTFWGKKPWSRKKKLICQLGTLVGAPVAARAGAELEALLVALVGALSGAPVAALAVAPAGADGGVEVGAAVEKTLSPLSGAGAVLRTLGVLKSRNKSQKLC